MQISEIEQKLLDKLKKGLLDGVIPGDFHWKAQGRVCRMIIVGGIPYYISFMEQPDASNMTFVVEQHYETDEMKLWFLKMHGWAMNDPEVLEYSRPIKLE